MTGHSIKTLAMTSLAMAAALTMLSLGAATAADLGEADEAMANPSVNWTGFYFGVNAGRGWGKSRWTFNDNNNQIEHGLGGVEIGVHGGYQRQWGHLIAGIEADVDGASLDGASSCPNLKFDCTTKVSGLESVRGRLGFSAGKMHVYGTAGLAMEQITHHTVEPTNPTNNESAQGGNLHGWVAGGGLEVLLAPNANIGIEVLHYNFAQQTLDLTKDISGNVVSDVTFAAQGENVVRLRFTMMLNGAAQHEPMK